MTTRLAAETLVEVMPDPPKKGDMLQHPYVVMVHSILEAHVAKRPNSIIIGEGYLVFDRRRRSGEEWRREFRPDCMIAFDVNPDAIRGRNGYSISDVGKPPDFVLEIASETTAERDVTVKRLGYAEMEVPEYWQFDWTGGRLYGAALAGHRLVEGVYQPIDLTTDADGMTCGHSDTLGLDLCWDGLTLRFYDPSIGEYLRTYRESEAELRAAEAELSRLRERLG